MLSTKREKGEMGENQNGVESRDISQALSRLDLSVSATLRHDKSLESGKDVELDYFHFASEADLQSFIAGLKREIENFNSAKTSLNNNEKNYFKTGAWRIRDRDATGKLFIRQIKFRFGINKQEQAELIIYT